MTPQMERTTGRKTPEKEPRTGTAAGGWTDRRRECGWESGRESEEAEEDAGEGERAAGANDWRLLSFAYSLSRPCVLLPNFNICLSFPFTLFHTPPNHPPDRQRETASQPG